MPVSRLLDIDPDKLFEDHSIVDIKTIQKRLQAENERKRVELRTIVGERYRDLIEAADTISDMKVTAEGVIGHIEKMSIKCQELQHQHLIGFKMDGERATNKNVANKAYYAMAVQIKILIDMPEQLWCAVEREDFLLGTQLFLFARHVHTGLQLHARSEKVSTSIAQWFPILDRQWTAVNHFHDAILTRCRSKLQTHNLSYKEASSCLSALILLQGMGSIELLSTFLELRASALRLVLESEQQVSGGVRSRVCTSLQLLIHTITLLHACFLGDAESEDSTPEGLVWKQLKSITSRDSPATVTLLDIQQSSAANFLPTIIKDFRPSTSERVNPVPPGVMRERVTEWLGFVERFVQSQVSSRLLAVATVKGLQAIREEAVRLVVQNEQWDLVCQRLMMPRSLNLWESFYQPLITARVKDIVTQNWTSILEQLIATLSELIQELITGKTSRDRPEHDLRWFVWSEWASDLPHGDHSHALGLSMKAKGYSPRVDKLCSDFDVQLKALLADLRYYLGNDTLPVLVPSTGWDKFADKSEITQHLRTCTMDNCVRLMEYVRTECLKHDNEACSILLARFLHALPDLCSTLPSCLTSSGPGKELGRWTELTTLLRRESLDTWRVWRTLVSSRFKVLVQHHLGTQHELSALLHSIPQYDAVSIEEQSDEGKSVMSNITVPSQPSLPLQALLNAACCETNAVIPHTLPTTIHQELIEHLVQDVFNHYETLVKSDNVTQARALQMSLDVKYVTALLVPRDNKVLISKSQEISDRIEDKVDPFDLDVYTPYIQNNIKRSVQRTQCLLGVLVAWPEKLAASASRSASKHSTAEDPNVLPLSATAPWFPLLPVTGPPGQQRITPSTLQPSPGTDERKKTASPKPKVEPTPGEMVRSGAAAFFGAMSTDWFGS